jgi:hypothetical protein
MSQSQVFFCPKFFWLKTLMKINILLIALTLSLLCSAQAQSGIGGIEPSKTPKLIKFFRPYGSDYAVSVYTTEESVRVEVSADKKKKTLWKQEDLGNAAGDPNAMDVMASRSGEYIAIITPAEKHAANGFVLFKHKEGIDFDQVGEKVIQGKFDSLLAQLTKTHHADHYGIDLLGWYSDPANVEEEEVMIKYWGMTALQDRQAVATRILFFNPKKNTFREKE